LSHNEIPEYSPSSKSSQRQSRKYSNPNIARSRFHLRRSDLAQIERARTRTLRMTIIIVLAFVLCWTPYAFMVFLYLIDQETANKLVDKGLQDTLFIFAVLNSCANPLVYGSFTMNFRRFLRRCCSKCSMRELSRKGSAQLQVPASRRSTHLEENTTYSNVEASPPSPMSFSVSIEANGSVAAL
jgi:gonadotropin-releasing hormone receptor